MVPAICNNEMLTIRQENNLSATHHNEVPGSLVTTGGVTPKVKSEELAEVLAALGAPRTDAIATRMLEVDKEAFGKSSHDSDTCTRTPNIEAPLAYY